MNPMGRWDLGSFGKFSIADQMTAGDRAIECYAGPLLPIYLIIHHLDCHCDHLDEVDITLRHVRTGMFDSEDWLVGLLVGLVEPLQKAFFSRDAPLRFLSSALETLGKPAIGVVVLLISASIGGFASRFMQDRAQAKNEGGEGPKSRLPMRFIVLLGVGRARDGVDHTGASDGHDAARAASQIADRGSRVRRGLLVSAAHVFQPGLLHGGRELVHGVAHDAEHDLDALVPK